MNKWVVDTCVIIDALSGLPTRNEADFKTLCPNLTIFNPILLVP